MSLISSPGIIFAFGGLVALLNSKTACGANAYFIVAQGSRINRVKRAAFFFLGAVVASTAIYSIFGLAGEIPGSVVFAVLAALWSVHAVSWYVRKRRWIPLGRTNVQADPHIASRGVFGVAYLGATLGSGLLTVMATPLVQVGALLCAAGGLPWAVFYGVGFAVGRSGPTWFAAWTTAGDNPDPHGTSLRFVTPTTSSRLAGGLLSFAALSVAVLTIA